MLLPVHHFMHMRVQSQLGVHRNGKQLVKFLLRWQTYTQPRCLQYLNIYWKVWFMLLFFFLFNWKYISAVFMLLNKWPIFTHWLPVLHRYPPGMKCLKIFPWRHQRGGSSLWLTLVFLGDICCHKCQNQGGVMPPCTGNVVTKLFVMLQRERAQKSLMLH